MAQRPSWREDAGRMVLLRAIRASNPTSVALIEGARRVTYGELADLALRTASGLRAQGVSPGAHVAVACPTGIDAVVAYLGVQAAGAVAVMVNYRNTTPEFEARFAVVDPRLVIVGGTGQIDLPDGVRVFRRAGDPSNDLPRLDESGSEAAQNAFSDSAAVLFTSGVSGAPRAVHLTHQNLLAGQRGQADMEGSALNADTIGLVALPLAHIFGLNSVLGALLRIGATAVLMDRFDAVAATALVAEHRVNAISAVPQMWHSFMSADIPDDTFANVIRATASAAPLPESTVTRMRERFGLKLAGGYGLTETSGTISLDDPRAPRTGSVGRPLGDTEVRLVDTDGEVPEEGDSGEIWLRGTSVCTQYLSVEGIESALDEDGWFHTGDVGVFDPAGRLSIVDRIKDVVIVGGFNVSPSEVETVLLMHPGVASAGVIGEPDEHSGERIVAFVRPSTNGSATVQELTDHCRRRLARYKVPTRFEVRDDLPLTDSGKVVRRLLR